MTKFENGGLYTIGVSDKWGLVESWTIGDSWFEAYRYHDTLLAGAFTSALGSTITMKEMTNAQYGQLENLNVSMMVYACGTDEGETLDVARSTIKDHFGLGE